MNGSVAQQKSLTTLPEGLDLLWETVGRIKVGMLTSAGPDGLLTGRPMTTVDVDRSGWLGFLVASDGALAQRCPARSARQPELFGCWRGRVRFDHRPRADRTG